MKHIFLLLTLFLLSSNAQIKNPIESPIFEDIIKSIIADEKYIFNDNIILKVPDFADNPFQVPIYVDGRKIPNAKRLVLFADYNPIPNIIDINLKNLLPVISINIKVAQGTPLRALILDDKNIWHVGSINIRSNGGGCDISAQSSNEYKYENRLGEIKTEFFPKDDGYRIKTSIFHPMETGLVFGTTAFYIDSIIIRNKDEILANISSTSVISENPRFTFESKNKIDNLTIEFTDNDGNKYKAQTK
jgi:sulfur-oxidizing protein SoxY